MTKVTELSSDAYCDLFIPNDTSRLLIDFCSNHKSVFIFGAGKIGKGMKHFLEQCDVPVNGFVTTDTFQKFKQAYKQGEAGLIIGLSDKFLDDVTPMINSIVCKKDLFLPDCEYRENIGSNFSVEIKRDNLIIVPHITSHCNLNCKYCRTFSPVSRPDFYELGEFVKDIKQLKKLNLPIKEFVLSGGEPLLHPNLFEMLRESRECFPNTTIKCITNGILLKLLNNKQLKELLDLDIIVQITKYPNVTGAIESFCAKAGDIKYNIATYEKHKQFVSDKLDMRGIAPKYDFYNCVANRDSGNLILMFGKLYNCATPAHVCYLNERFKTDFQVRAGDFIDIYNTTPEDIYNFKISRTPFCDYHDSANRLFVDWGVSDRKVEEWVHFE